MKEVIIVFGDRVTRIPVQQWDDVMDYMAGQMVDDIAQDMIDRSLPRARGTRTLDAYSKMSNATLQATPKDKP